MALQTAAADTIAAHRRVVATGQRLDVGWLRKVSRNPLDALPPEIYEHPLVSGWGPLGGALHVLDPELIQDILVRRAEVFGKTASNRRVLGPTLGESLLVAEGAHWRWQRRAAAPVFQPAKLGALAPAMLAAARDTRDRWLARPGETLRLNHEMMRTTFAIIIATMLSGPGAVDAGGFEAAMNAALHATGWSLATAALRLPKWTPYPGRTRSRRATAHLRTATAHLVAAHRRSDDVRPDLLSLLKSADDPETGRAFSDEELVDNLLTFIAAGHETTALGLAWTFHLLAAHPAIEARAVAEVDSVTGGEEVKPEHLEALPYLKQVFSEAMRLFPPAPIISRAAREATELGGVPMNRGDAVVIPIYALHRHKLLWTDPERFDPERFAPAAVHERHRFAFMPFGGGPHICIGAGFAMLEAVAILAVMLQSLRVRAAPGADAPEPVMKITLRPGTDLMVNVERRAIA